MPIINQQSSILSEQELQLLASHSAHPLHDRFKIYSYQCNITLAHCQLHLSDSLEQFILMLSASPRGIATILPDYIEHQPNIDKLVTLLTKRADIRVFWLGKLPSMETNLLTFVHCSDNAHLKENVNLWQSYVKRTFGDWLENYPVAFITDNEQKKSSHQSALSEIGLQKVEYFSAHSALTQLKQQKLLIIDIHNHELRLIDLLSALSSKAHFPIIIIYAELPANVCRATYTLIDNQGFPILASLTSIPDKKQWSTLFSSLFSKVYLKHWVNEEIIKTGAYPVYDLETQSVDSYFCLYGMSKAQIASLDKHNNMRHILNIRSLKDWFPDGIKRELRAQLAQDLSCDMYNIDLCIEHPEKILRTSLIFSTLVMARLSKAKIYWLIENEIELLDSILKDFPISEVILSDQLSHQLLTEPSESLLEFLQQAQTQQVNIIATLQQSRSTNDALALYGIASVLNKQYYIEQIGTNSF